MERAALFVDGANMYFAQKRLGWYIDFRRVLEYVAKDLNLRIVEAFYYTGTDTQQRGREVAFHEYLIHSGYTVRTKAIKQSVDDSTGEMVEKANLDIELVIDMLNTTSSFDVCVLMSGDGDFERALEVLRARGKRPIVIAHPEMAAREIRNVAGSNFLDIRELEPQIARRDRLPELGMEAPAVAVARAVVPTETSRTPEGTST